MEYGDGAIIDEIRQAPSLLNHLQGEVDERGESGRFILTGSRHFGLSQAIVHTGRTLRRSHTVTAQPGGTATRRDIGSGLDSCPLPFRARIKT